jgi:hypothetical protein
LPVVTTVLLIRVTMVRERRTSVDGALNGPSGSLGVVVAIPVKPEYTVVGKSCDEPTTEGSVAYPDQR